jgi:PAS domain S-box-containing protein
LSAIVDSSDDAIIGKDLNGTITSWNKSAERLFGYTAEELVGKSITLLIPPDRQNEEPEILARLRMGERVDHFETLRRRKDGTLLDISLTISTVKNARGETIGASKTARDTTEAKRADRNNRLLSAIVDSSDDAIISKDLNGTITSWNCSAERLFGYTAAEAIGPLRYSFRKTAWTRNLRSWDGSVGESAWTILRRFGGKRTAPCSIYP